MNTLNPSTVIKLKDAEIIDILADVKTRYETGGYCETCFYDYEILETKIDFKLKDGTIYNFIDDEEVDIDYPADQYMTTADLFKVFIDFDFLEELKTVELKDFNNALAKRMYLMFVGNPEKNGLVSLLNYTYSDALREYQN